MDQEPGHSQRNIADQQAVMTENLERVDARVQEPVDGLKSTVESALEGFKQVQEAVDGAKTAVEEVLERVNAALREAVEGAKTTVERIDPAQLQQNPWALVQATAELINPAHVNQAPWILVGSAIVMGYLLGTLERHTAFAPEPGDSSAGRHERRGT
jgi:ElaB/YqjD/DUF883 family membrane-anchored ribosome-binding protein